MARPLPLPRDPSPRQPSPVARTRPRPRAMPPAGRELTPAIAAPFVKWVGGKGKLTAELARRAPATYRRYFEPFVGGGALFFHLSPASATLSDVNADLVGCYRALRDDCEAVIAELARHRELHSEGYYYAMRDGWNASALAGDAARAAAFIYLNKTCYNGLWRVNRSGRFNVPAGRYLNPSILDAERLRAASAALRAATLEVAPFEHVLDLAWRGDFVYFDPPYHPVSDTADFVAYAAGGFGGADQERLAETFARLDERGCAVLLSNSDTPFTRRLYGRWRIDRVLAPRAVNSRADRRGAVAEIVVSNRF